MANPEALIKSKEVAKHVYTVSVRQLVEFVLRTGDLGSGRKLSRQVRAWEGSRGHRKLQNTRPETYEAEVAISHDVDVEDFILRIGGPGIQINVLAVVHSSILR